MLLADEDTVGTEAPAKEKEGAPTADDDAPAAAFTGFTSVAAFALAGLPAHERHIR